MVQDRQTVRLDISRKAATLFLERGVGATSGKDIAAAAGVSERSVWRHFRTKESCVEPLFTRSAARFSDQLRSWSRRISLEDHLTECFAAERQAESDIRDGVLIVKLVAAMAAEPDLRAEWLLATDRTEQDLIGIIAGRMDLPLENLDVRLCAATVAAAIRFVDETVSRAAINAGDVFTTADVVTRMARAIRAAAILPFCDPVAPRPAAVSP